MFLDARNPPTDIAGFDPTSDVGDACYDAEAAEKAVQFFPKVLHFTKGLKAGEPFYLEDWQSDIVKTIFGWRRPDGSRRFRTIFAELARKNGKTTLVAGIANYVLFCDGESGAECYCGASNRDQAGLLFSTAAQQVRKSVGLDRRCLVRDSQKRIVYQDSFLRAIPANEGGSHGFDSHLIVGDELHAWPGREFYDVLHTSTGARRQPLEIYITTAGHDRRSICWEVYQYAKQVRDKKITDRTFLPAIYEVAESEDWTDKKNWKKANPNIGVSISQEYLDLEFAKAEKNPSYANTFRRLHLNQWTSIESRWLRMDKWRACRVSELGIQDGAEVYGGLDLSSRVDLTAWSMVERTSERGWRAKVHYFIPQESMSEAEKRDRVPYSRWVDEGYVTATNGSRVDYSVVRRRILDDAERYNLRFIGYDPWNAEDTRVMLEHQGIEMVKIRQGMASLSSPSKEFECCVIDGTLDHGGDPVLEWMAENTMVQTDVNANIRPVKPDHKSGARIDGIVATIMAIGVGQSLQPDGPSPFDQPGMLAL